MVHCVILYNVRKILSPSSSLLLLAKTIMHPAARSLCNSWASCCENVTRTEMVEDQSEVDFYRTRWPGPLWSL